MQKIWILLETLQVPKLALENYFKVDEFSSMYSGQTQKKSNIVVSVNMHLLPRVLGGPWATILDVGVYTDLFIDVLLQIEVLCPMDHSEEMQF